jgi:ATP-binding cassette subfamily B protein
LIWKEVNVVRQNSLAKEVKGRNMVSNVLVTLNVVFGIIPFFIVVAMSGRLIDQTMTIRQIWLGGAWIVGCAALKALFYGLSIWKAHDAAYGALREIRVGMIGHLKKLPLSFFQEKKTGDLANIINHDVEQVELYLAHALPEIMSATFVPAGAFLAVLLLNWRLGLALVGSVPLMFLLRKVFDRLWAGSIQHFMRSTKKMSEDLLEYIAAISVIKAFSQEEQKTGQVLDRMYDYIRWVKKVVLNISLPMGFITMMLECGLIVMVIIGSRLLAEGQLDMQKFVLAFILGGVFSASFVKLATFQHYGIVFNQAMGSINTVMGVKPQERGDRYPSPHAGAILVDKVSFSYHGDGEALSQISLSFKENSVNAVVGASGSGKSTLANLMMGFWQPDEGTISIGGQNIADLSERALSSLISIVQQEVFLFNLSIADNIRIGRQDATKEEIVAAAKRAQIHDFIMSLPRGYETMAGEAGAKLSGGEKQRIAIARVMLKNAPIIILDEATAAIDPNNEHLIQKAFANLGENKTLIMIAHHLNTIRGADQIVVMDEGRIIATGKHEELLGSCPLYAEMVERQNAVDSWQIKEALA